MASEITKIGVLRQKSAAVDPSALVAAQAEGGEQKQATCAGDANLALIEVETQIAFLENKLLVLQHMISEVYADRMQGFARKSLVGLVGDAQVVADALVGAVHELGTAVRGIA